MSEVWVVRLVEVGEMEPRPSETLIGARSSLASVERLVARRWPRFTRYEADPGEFADRGGRFVDPSGSDWPRGDLFIRVDRFTVDDPSAEA